MKKKTLYLASFALALLLVLVLTNAFFSKNTEHPHKKNDDIVNLHNENLKNSPYKETLKLSKKERKALGIPPDSYFEQEYELTMNPFLGRPTPENLKDIRDQRDQLLSARVPGDGLSDDWEARGPDNVGGRTRGLMFDPNDTSNNTVFAGGVSGGLFKNSDITDENSVWERLDLPENLNVSVIAADPNNPSVFYLGTGESYTNGDVSGNGVWKSSDAGQTWNRVLGGVTGPAVFESASNITVNSPNTIAGDYASIETTSFGSPINSTITGDFILANDVSSPTPEEGCAVFGADATGKIAVIVRGNCNFTTKVKNAQDAGAIAVIVVNNVDGAPIPLGGTDSSITIPSVMISKQDGDAIIAELATNVVNGSLNPASGLFTGVLVPGIQHINDLKIKDNGGVSEIYVAAGDAFYGDANVTTFLGGLELGVFKSVDEGQSWTKLNVPQTVNGNEHEPNDIEVGADGKIWLATIDSSIFGDGGGEIFSSSDGENFILEHTVAQADRTEIAVSSQDAGKIYVLAEIPGGVKMEGTTDGFNTNVFDLALPDDADDGIPTNDFTRGQAFYDLLLEVSPVNDQIVYAGGIDLFKSTNGGEQGGANSWAQISKWSNNNNLATLSVPLVHADQHAMAFAPGNHNIMIFGNDGGVYYATGGGITNESRNKGFITSQFYTVGVAPTTTFSGDTDHFIGGLQDNGTQLFSDVDPGVNSSSTAFGGDGAYSFFDQDGTDQYYITNFVFNRITRLVNLATNTTVTINSESSNNGSFINPQELDSNLDILYSNYSSGNVAVIRRYSGIKEVSTLESTNLTHPTLSSRPTAFKVSPYTTSSSTLLVGTVLGDIIRMENAQANPIYTSIEPGNDIVGSISDIEFGRSESEIFVTVHNYGVESIWYTDDGGGSWVSKEGNLPDLPVKAILQNPLNTEEVIIGTELGIWFTNDFSSASPNWQPAQGGMSNVRITDIDLRDDNAIYVSTYGRGVFSGKFTIDPAGDADGDGVLNANDNCINTPNADQADIDGNGVGDVCQDTDDDGILDINDNCPEISNANQEDLDGDGVGDVCQDSDGDSILDATDNCIDTPNPNQEDQNANGIGDICDTSYEDPNNISVEITSERCEGQDNGSIRVEVEEFFVNYTLNLIGSGLNLTQTIAGNLNTTVFNNIPVGLYSLCVSVDGRDYQQCFEISINEAPSLGGVFNAVNDQTGENSTETAINIDTGTAPFSVFFNDELIMVTSQVNFVVNTQGEGTLAVTSSIACEGKLTTQIRTLPKSEMRYGPNPVIDELEIRLPNLDVNSIEVNVYDVTGKRLFKGQNPINEDRLLRLSFNSYPSGIYFIQLNIKDAKVIKIIKA